MSPGAHTARVSVSKSNLTDETHLYQLALDCQKRECTHFVCTATSCTLRPFIIGLLSDSTCWIGSSGAKRTL